MVTPDAERTMHTYLGVSDNISISEMNFESGIELRVYVSRGISGDLRYRPVCHH